MKFLEIIAVPLVVAALILLGFTLGVLLKSPPEIVTLTEYVVIQPPTPRVIRPTKEEDQVIVNWIKDKDAMVEENDNSHFCIECGEETEEGEQQCFDCRNVTE